MRRAALEDIELKLLLEGVFQVYGHDFREYADASLKRRLSHWLAESGFDSFSAVQARVLRDEMLFNSLLQGITVNVSEMFRDPDFFLALRQTVVPYLKTYPFLKIWVAGCATGEEVYSLAILLHEEGLAGRFRLYATDINEQVLEQAQRGVYPLDRLQQFTRNYHKAGGVNVFSDYYTARYDRAILAGHLRRDVVFASHNLAVDGEFGEMHLVLCRNVMIYFNNVLKERVLRLFDSGLCQGGFLCLGQKEVLDGRSIADGYEEVMPRIRIYRKRYGRVTA